MNEKTVKTSGADERTPSRSEYFSWINNTNEGSTEKQTLVNLAFFRYLKERYRMSLDIYAWDAGNLDGAGNSYETLDGEKLSKQYPHGYAPSWKPPPTWAPAWAYGAARTATGRTKGTRKRGGSSL